MDLLDIVHRYTRTCSNRFAIHFGILVECEDMSDVVTVDSASYPKEYREKVIVHHTVRLADDAHWRRRNKMKKKFVSGMEDMVVFADARVVPEFGWDVHLLAALENVPSTVITCPLCAHPAGFPTLRTRSNGDVVRDDAKAFFHAGEPGTFVDAVCLCHEFVACHPLSMPNDRTVHVVVPTFPVVAPVAEAVEEGILEANLQPQAPRLTNTAKLGLTERPTGPEMYHKYGSASAARLAIKMDRRSK